jgi:hypothetical protein
VENQVSGVSFGGAIGRNLDDSFHSFRFDASALTWSCWKVISGPSVVLSFVVFFLNVFIRVTRSWRPQCVSNSAVIILHTWSWKIRKRFLYRAQNSYSFVLFWFFFCKFLNSIFSFYYRDSHRWWERAAIIRRGGDEHIHGGFYFFLFSFLSFWLIRWFDWGDRAPKRFSCLCGRLMLQGVDVEAGKIV